jgi:hypothetical protein
VRPVCQSTKQDTRPLTQIRDMLALVAVCIIPFGIPLHQDATVVSAQVIVVHSVKSRVLEVDGNRVRMKYVITEAVVV